MEVGGTVSQSVCLRLTHFFFLHNIVSYDNNMGEEPDEFLFFSCPCLDTVSQTFFRLSVLEAVPCGPVLFLVSRVSLSSLKSFRLSSRGKEKRNPKSPRRFPQSTGVFGTPGSGAYLAASCFWLQCRRYRRGPLKPECRMHPPLVAHQSLSIIKFPC